MRFLISPVDITVLTGATKEKKNVVLMREINTEIQKKKKKCDYTIDSLNIDYIRNRNLFLPIYGIWYFKVHKLLRALFLLS